MAGGRRQSPSRGGRGMAGTLISGRGGGRGRGGGGGDGGDGGDGGGRGGGGRGGTGASPPARKLPVRKAKSPAPGAKGVSFSQELMDSPPPQRLTTLGGNNSVSPQFLINLNPLDAAQ
jgi:hypothetical protein